MTDNRGVSETAIHPVRNFSLDRDGVELAGLDFAGEGTPVLLLHGLAGYAGEWRMTADWLAGPAPRRRPRRARSRPQ